MTSDQPIRRSVEVEYWVVDGEGRLTDPGPLADVPGTDRECVEPILEVKTPPCESTAELRTELFDRVGAVLEQADERRLVPLGTPIHATDIPQRPTKRADIQRAVLGEEFTYIHHCAGTHVHVEQQPGAAVDQFNAFVAADPALALLNSSPYFRGERVAASARSKLYRWLAYENVPQQGELWPYVTDQTVWTRRLERRYEEFCRRARETGVPRTDVVANFDPESTVWTPVQFREAFGTVEWRSADAALPSQAVRLADALAGLASRVRSSPVRIDGEAGRVTDEEVVLPAFDAVLDYSGRAVREGLADDGVAAYLTRLGFDPAAYEPLAGTFEDRETVTVEEARADRLAHAGRLERDVQRARSTAD
jgi:gamma-glutamyl:cysteine ligase YbdK (ATP-grasp superfamily)